MTPDDVKKAIQEIYASDLADTAHRLEDELRELVLQSIADGTCTDPAACARLALTTADISFPRWYS